MSTHALGSSRPASPAAALRWLDILVVAAALPVFLVAGLPLLAYGVCAGVWVALRALHVPIFRRVAGAESPRAAMGLLAASMLARVWLMAGAILAVGLADRDAGLPAAVLAIVVFQVYFTTNFITRMLERKATR